VEFDDQLLRVAYNSAFVDVRYDQFNNLLIPKPYDVYVRFGDGRKELLDVCLNKKFNKYYSMDQIRWLELCFPSIADF
jgi:hypothetical protein